jgi:hypothetical protein
VTCIPSGIRTTARSLTTAGLIAEDIAGRLSELDSANAATYQTNLKAFLDKLDSSMFGADPGQSAWISPAVGAQAQRRLDRVASRPGKGDALAGWEGRMSRAAARKS